MAQKNQHGPGPRPRASQGAGPGKGSETSRDDPATDGLVGASVCRNPGPGNPQELVGGLKDTAPI